MRASYKMSLTPADNGVVVRVGCKLFVFEDVDKFHRYLKRYLEGEEDQLRKELCPEGPYGVPPEGREGLPNAPIPEPMAQGLQDEEF